MNCNADRPNSNAPGGLFGSLIEPGDTPTLFVGARSGVTASARCFRWRWGVDGGFDPEVRALLGDTEPEEAFHDTADIVEEVLGLRPAGIRMFSEDLQFARAQGARFEGGSLGVAFLLGALCWADRRQWPGRVVAWGAIQPDRNGTWKLVPTSNTAPKVMLARHLGADAIVRIARDPVPGSRPFPRPISIQATDGIDAALELLEYLRDGTLA